MKNSFRQTICSLVIISMIMMPFLGLSIKKTEAASLSSYISSLAPVIVKLPGCKKALGGGISDLFGSIKNAFSGKGTNAAKEKSLNKVLGETGQGTIPTFDSEGNEKLDTLGTKVDESKKAQESIDKNQNCLNGIGKAIAKILVTELTDSIVNWVKTGDFGDPFYVQNADDFFGDIAKNEIMQFGIEINDPELFPFGQAFMQKQAASYQNHFADNAEYSLNKIIQAQNPQFSAQTFNLDFSQGGWGAWNALTQVPGNNPLDFQIMASSELQKRLAGTTQSTAQDVRDALKEAGGFLGSQQCRDPKGLTRSEHDAGLLERSTSPTGPYENEICTGGWQYVTPGKLIGDQLVSAVQKKDNALMNVETLNDAMAAILDAVLAKFTNSLQVEGLVSVEESNPYDSNGSDGINFTTNNDYTEGQINGSTWLKQHPDFDIRIDITQALIDEQRIYLDKLKQQNKTLIDGGPANPEGTNNQEGYTGLIPTIYQLDYCLPGPHPGYEDAAQEKLEEIQAKMAGMNFVDMTEKGWFKFVDDLTLGALGTVVNFVNSYAFDCGSDAGSQAHSTFVNQIATMLDIPHVTLNSSYADNSSFCTVEGFNLSTNRAMNEYKRIIRTAYTNHMPSSSKEAISEFNKIEGYRQIMKNNETTMAAVTGAIKQLERLKIEVDAVNEQLRTGAISESEYESGASGITPWKNLFARLSFSLYSGDDISKIDSLTKQMIDETNYVAKSLIKGPAGCEEELANNTFPGGYKYWQIYNSERPIYPMPHLYHYNGRLMPSTSTDPATYEIISYAPDTVFFNSNGITIPDPNPNGPNAWIMDGFNLAGFMDTNSPHKGNGGAGAMWERALGIW